MNLTDLMDVFKTHPQLSLLSEWIIGKESSLYVRGMEGSLKSFVFAYLYGLAPCSLFFVMNDSDDAAYFYNDLAQILGKEKVLFFPSSYKRAVKYGQKDSANEVLRTEALAALESHEKLIVVSYPEAISELVVSSKELNQKTLQLNVGLSVDMQFLVSTLDEFGFSRVDFVYEPGQYSVRGSLLDIFSYSCEYPFRIDFFGDEVDSIRTFDIENQLSKDKKESISIVPNVHQKESTTVSLLRFLDKRTILGFNDFGFVYDRVTKYFDESDDRSLLMEPSDYWAAVASFRRLEFGFHAWDDSIPKVEFSSQPQPLFHKNFDLASAHFKEMMQDGYQIYVLSDSLRQTERLQNIFDDRGDKVTFQPVLKTIHEGFFDRDLKVCCYTDHQFFDRFHKYNLRSDRAREGRVALTLKELSNFQIGDYVVHINHGVGRFGGLMTTDVNGKKQEVIKIIYKDDDLLFVSIHSLHKISRYKGKEGDPPRINKLGSGSWQALKEKTKKKVKDIARDLILLYSKRRSEKGFSFSPDSFLQSELEASFFYEDTPDQVKATADVKHDMERDMPMDRLICGDVGFGKTEIAVRAAFKAVSDNKQVAVLVPTTVLALQHYKTFSERLKGFPCRVDYLSRSRKSKDVRGIIKDLQDGNINVLIGTHKLIGKEVKFKDLGLLVIDEEQKFGVSVKEKIRQMKVNVDTLTLTATPIPRTLQFSLMGARDLSVMRTPPPNRYPIQTELHSFNEDIIREAIQYEIDRNGQVFFINNRIQNLEELRVLVNRLVPEARVAIGHGQMSGEELEKVIVDFLDYEYDVLIATSIVESGVDISNCNTIIINNAHHFGLSELHQLRGRVGRSNRRAFCYLLSPPLSGLTTDARRRLQAIESFSDLGSGFNIAMQDLDIRGAGNLLGAEQSGFIADLGYETYQKVLTEAVMELKEDEFAELYEEEKAENGEDGIYVYDCQMETDMELMFPSDYIESVSERMNLYRELDNVKDEAALKAYESRLQDRFGKLPQEALNLLQLVRLRWLAISLGFERMTLKNERMIGYFVMEDDSPYYQSKAFGKILSYFQSHAIRCKLREQTGKRSIVFSDVRSINEAYNILDTIEHSTI
ncbi:MAG: transcription-repair coupling factor [Paludibacteraceae bacterium]|nr:transcription-repair coupling factor [Paludibacteraceae bacterium]